IACTPDAGRLHYQLGLVLERLGTVDDAIHAFTEAHRLRPRHVQALTALGEIHRRRGDWRAEADVYAAALVVEPGKADHHASRGLALGALGDYAGAAAE